MTTVKGAYSASMWLCEKSVILSHRSFLEIVLSSVMRKVISQMNEEQKYQVIKVLMDHGGNKQRVALKSGVSMLVCCRSRTGGANAVYPCPDPGSFIHAPLQTLLPM